MRRHSLNANLYHPGNCRWATRSEQRRNSRGKSHFLTVDGATKRLEDWAHETGLRKSTLFNRIKRGWGDDEAVKRPAAAKAEDHTILPPGGFAHIKALGLNPETVKSRLRRGWSFDRAISAPIDHARGKRHASASI